MKNQLRTPIGSLLAAAVFGVGSLAQAELIRNSVSATGGLDSWSALLVVNESDTFANTDAGIVTLGVMPGAGAAPLDGKFHCGICRGRRGSGGRGILGSHALDAPGTGDASLASLPSRRRGWRTDHLDVRPSGVPRLCSAVSAAPCVPAVTSPASSYA